MLKRRNDQLDEMNWVNGFLNDIADFSNLLNDCASEFKEINEELKKLGMDDMLDDDAAAAAEESLNSLDDANETKGDQHHNKTISRENSFVPDTPAIKHRRNWNL